MQVWTAPRLDRRGRRYWGKWALAAFVLIAIVVSLPIALHHAIRRTIQHDETPAQQIDQQTTQQAARKMAITEAFQHAWEGYSRSCFGRDSLHPVSNLCEDDYGGYGATAIDALPTAIIMNQGDVVAQILRHIESLDFQVVAGGKKIQVFEVTIRHLAAMISAWDLLKGPHSSMVSNPTVLQALFTQMVHLGEILTCAFNTPTGIPHDWVDPATCSADGSQSTVAGAGTIVLEFGRLSTITGNGTYALLAQKAESYLLRPSTSAQPFPGLLGSYVDINSGEIVGVKGSWGAFADSFYEYLLKAYLYDSALYGDYLDRWLIAAESTIQSVGSHPYGHPEWTLLASWDGTSLGRRMESLSWFAGGSFILAGMVMGNNTLINYGLSIADTARAVYSMTVTRLGGEFVAWDTACNDSCDAGTSLRIVDGRFRLRPEVLETWYYAYRATKDAKYRDWSWAAIEAINQYCRTDTGFSAIWDVDASDGGGKSDVQESFVFAEVMKYAFLIQLEDTDVPYHVQDSRMGVKNAWVFNTEAHPFLVAGSPV